MESVTINVQEFGCADLAYWFVTETRRIFCVNHQAHITRDVQAQYRIDLVFYVPVRDCLAGLELWNVIGVFTILWLPEILHNTTQDRMHIVLNPFVL